MKKQTSGPMALANNLERRQFISTLAKAAAGAATFFMVPALGVARQPFCAPPITIQQVIDLILKDIPGAPFPNTVDTIKSGDANQVVRGIVTTMFATAAVIEKAARLGANFIIAHEPTFYSHTDESEWLKEDKVYQYKKSLLEKHNITVWRFHDSIHAHLPDGVMMGVLTALGWAKYYNADNPRLITIPATHFQNIIALTKSKLHIAHVRYIGNLQQSCSRILLLPGAAGGKKQIEALMKDQPDLVIVGEVNEWETSEYIRDLRYMGGKTALLDLGHIQSEEPGLQWLVTWLQPQLPGIRITHVPSTDAFSWA